VKGRRGDVLAWNEPTEALYRCSTIPVPRRNVLAFLFSQPDVRRLILNWEEQARYAIAAYRAELAKAPSDEWMLEVHELLSKVSADFRRLWADEPGRAVKPLIKVFRKPAFGRLSFQLEDLVPRDASAMTIAVYVPTSADDTQRRLDKLVASYRKGKLAKREAADYRLVRKVKEHLDECYMREVPLDELAALANVGRFRLARTFAAEVGFPPHAYQMLVRIENAKRMLLDGAAASDIARIVGFVDQSHMIRHFRRIEGITPFRFAKGGRRQT
jgi:AraC-like DNA-binding protein